MKICEMLNFLPIWVDEHVLGRVAGVQDSPQEIFKCGIFIYNLILFKAVPQLYP